MSHSARSRARQLDCGGRKWRQTAVKLVGDNGTDVILTETERYHLNLFRLGISDKSDESFARFACGHPGCADCVAATECRTCSSLMDPKASRSRFDDLKTSGAKIFSEQDTSQTSVYQKQRISEQLRVEKELFPQCIQAPAKYYNKRKSLNVSKRGKENRHTIFPGEAISPSVELTMNKSRNNVQEWLNKQPKASLGPQSRSPFCDLKVNTHHNQPAHSTPLKGKLKENTPTTRQSNRKRSRLKQTPTAVSQISLENYLKPPGKSDKKTWGAKRLKQEFDDTSKHVARKGSATCDESGIVIDDDCFTIEDTPEPIVDKDKLALLEVQKASVNEVVESLIEITDTETHPMIEEPLTSHDEKFSHVPFYKKSPLYENCSQCVIEIQDTIPPKKSNDVSITVENKSFIATISIVDCNQNTGKKSTAIQTDIQEPFFGFEQPTPTGTHSLIAKYKDYIKSEDIGKENQVIEIDSQTSTDFVSETQNGNNKDDGNVAHVDNTMAGHSSEHEFGVLTTLHGAGFQNKTRRGPRAATPDSNNSSDKENFDPNRRRKGAGNKKKGKNK